ncbi:MAG: TIGR03435 family protein [Acidobacteriia bacterium]|nr:TIGR03435 family protein [Terriglobia bacterium]
MQTLLFESAVRATLIATAVALVLWIMRIKTASVLHAVWASVVVLMLLLPAWVAWGPKAPLPVLPPDRTPVVALSLPPLPAGLADATPRTSPARQDGGYALPDAVTMIYFLGFGVLLFRLVIGTVRASRLKFCVAPITVGILHSRIVLPESAKNWPQAQLDAVLAHEGEHVRRRDPLFQWLALLNRAIFWFHPLAWWLERRLSGLAEEACDAAVIARGYDPREYSGYLLDLAKSVQRAGTRVSALGMAMPGIGLKHRIQQMLNHAPSPRISRKRMAIAASACAMLSAIFAAGTLVRAQSAARPVFEVASIRPSDAGPGSVRQIKPDGLTYMNRSLAEYILLAYGVESYQLTHGPAVSLAERYDIVAKAAGPVPESQVKLMLRSLLEDRFRLSVHRESKELPVYILTVAKGGPHFNKSEDDGPMGAAPKDGFFLYRRTSMAYLAGTLLSNLPSLRRPVLDRTELDGIYDFSLHLFDPDAAKSESDPKGDLVRQVDNGLTASLKDLGLKLESQRAPIEIVVIDHVEKPSEN